MIKKTQYLARLSCLHMMYLQPSSVASFTLSTPSLVFEVILIYLFLFFGPPSLVVKVIFCFLHLICGAAFLARGDLKMEKTHGTETPSAENLIASAFEAKRIIPQRTVTKSLRQQVSILFSFLCFPFFFSAAPDLLRCHCVSDN